MAEIYPFKKEQKFKDYPFYVQAMASLVLFALSSFFFSIPFVMVGLIRYLWSH
jgi:hypothetical protein